MISYAIASKFDKKLTETLPVGVYAFMLAGYLLGITGHISHITELLIIWEIMGLAVSAWIIYKEKKDIRFPFTDPGLAVFAVMIIVIWFVSLHMRVTNFDDFHSWAITPKNIYAIDGVPTGGMASSFYRDYFPVVMYMDYLVFKLIGTYSESAMFAVLWWLMLVMTLPFLHKERFENSIRYTCKAAIGLLVPFLMSFQFLHCLGLDIAVTMLFGSILTYLFAYDKDADAKDRMFNYLRLLVSITLLGMLKTTSLIFAAVCVAVYTIKELEASNLRSWIRCGLIPVVTMVFWISWKVFCRIKGNTTYLSDNLSRNMQSGHYDWPYYTASTIKAFTAKLFTYGLNDGRAGLTAFCMLLVFIIAIIIYRHAYGYTVRDVLSFAAVLCGMFGYLLVMIYIYLFVFEEWEALSLSSYDRYISTYFGALLYVAVFVLMINGRFPVWIQSLLLLLMFSTVNYAYVSATLLPAGYEAAYGDTLREKEEIIKEFSDAVRDDPVRYGENIVIIDESEDQLRAKVLPYAAVPGVVKLIEPDDTGAMPTEDEIAEIAEECGAERIVDLRHPAGGQ